HLQRAELALVLFDQLSYVVPGRVVRLGFRKRAFGVAGKANRVLFERAHDDHVQLGACAPSADRQGLGDGPISQLRKVDGGDGVELLLALRHGQYPSLSGSSSAQGCSLAAALRWVRSGCTPAVQSVSFSPAVAVPVPVVPGGVPGPPETHKIHVPRAERGPRAGNNPRQLLEKAAIVASDAGRDDNSA